MNETQLILDAMSSPAPAKKKRKVMPEIEPDIVEASNDAIWKLSSKRKPKKQSTRPISRWTGPDFLRFMTQSLRQSGLDISTVEIRDSNLINSLYDKLAKYLQEQMSNVVLRDYISWWVSYYAKYTSGPVSVYSFLNDDHVSLFLNTIGHSTTSLKTDKPKDPMPEVDPETLLQIGGLSMLIMSKGIVVAHRVLRETTPENAIPNLLTTMQSFSKDVIEDVVQTTLCGGPYLPEDLVDFMSIARPSLKYHRITKYDNLRYQDHFRSVN